MSNQLTNCIDVEVGAAPGSRPATGHRRILAIAAAVGSQFLAFVAVAQDTINPILDPALSHTIAFGAGIVVGVVLIKASGGKKKD